MWIASPLNLRDSVDAHVIKGVSGLRCSAEEHRLYMVSEHVPNRAHGRAGRIVLRPALFDEVLELRWGGGLPQEARSVPTQHVDQDLVRVLAAPASSRVTAHARTYVTHGTMEVRRRVRCEWLQ